MSANLTRSKESHHLVNCLPVYCSLEINFYFAACGLPIMLFITIYTGEIYDFLEVLEISDFNHKVWFITYICISGVMGIAITLSVLIVCTLVSPIAFNVTGNLKDVALTYIGFIFFEDANLTFMVGVGLLLSFIGSGAYIIDRY
jgi:hypothetical protein